MQSLVDYLRQHVPLTREINIVAGEFNEEWFELEAPLAPNLNDKNTAFGGSLATLCTLSGWCITALVCREASQNIDISVLDSQIRYRLPVKTDPIIARAYMPTPSATELFIEQLKLEGRARLSINVEVSTAHKTAVSFGGLYYARVLDSNSP